MHFWQSHFNGLFMRCGFNAGPQLRGLQGILPDLMGSIAGLKLQSHICKTWISFNKLMLAYSKYDHRLESMNDAISNNVRKFLRKLWWSTGHRVGSRGSTSRTPSVVCCSCLRTGRAFGLQNYLCWLSPKFPKWVIQVHLENGCYQNDGCASSGR